MFPPQWHMHCCIAERSSKHRRHLGLLPGSCNSKSCPWSGMGGMGGSSRSGSIASNFWGFLGCFFPNDVCHWPHVALRPLLSITLAMVSLSLYLSLSLSLFICWPQLLLHLELSASKCMISIRTEPWESCELVPPCWNSLQCSGVVLLPCQKKSPKLFFWQTYQTHEMAAVDFLSFFINWIYCNALIWETQWKVELSHHTLQELKWQRVTSASVSVINYNKYLVSTF